MEIIKRRVNATISHIYTKFYNWWYMHLKHAVNIIRKVSSLCQNKHLLVSCPTDELNVDMGKFLLGVGEFY